MWAVGGWRGAGEVVELVSTWSSSIVTATVFCCWDTHTGNSAGKSTLELVGSLLLFSKVGIEKASRSKTPIKIRFWYLQAGLIIAKETVEAISLL